MPLGKSRLAIAKLLAALYTTVPASTSALAEANTLNSPAGLIL